MRVLNGVEYISLIERTHGASFRPGIDWAPEELEWNARRKAQFGRGFAFKKSDVVELSKTYVRNELLQPIIDALSDEHAKVVKNLPIGLVNIRALNAQAVRAPNGDPVIVFNMGILQIFSYWWERLLLMRREHAVGGNTASMRHIVETYSFLLMLIRDNGQIAYPQPAGRLSEGELAAIVRRSMQAELFILAHEIGHIVLNHPLSTPEVGSHVSAASIIEQERLTHEHELHADIFGYHLFMQAWPRHRISRGELDIEDLLAPLEYFKIRQLVERNPEVVPDYGQSASHPTAEERADTVLRPHPLLIWRRRCARGTRSRARRDMGTHSIDA